MKKNPEKNTYMVNTHDKRLLLHQFQSASRSSSSMTDELNSEKPLRSPAGPPEPNSKHLLFFVAFSPASSCLSEGSVLMLPVCIVVAFASVVVFFLVCVLVFSWSSESVFAGTLCVLLFVAGTVLSPVFSSDEPVKENLESLARVELANFTFVWSALGGDCGCLLVLPLFSPGERLLSLDSSCCWCSVSSDVPFWTVLTSFKTWEETSLVLLLVPSRGFLLALLPSAGWRELDRFPLSACFSGIWGAVGFTPSCTATLALAFATDWSWVILSLGWNVKFGSLLRKSSPLSALMSGGLVAVFFSFWGFLPCFGCTVENISSKSSPVSPKTRSSLSRRDAFISFNRLALSCLEPFSTTASTTDGSSSFSHTEPLWCMERLLLGNTAVPPSVVVAFCVEVMTGRCEWQSRFQSGWIRSGTSPGWGLNQWSPHHYCDYDQWDACWCGHYVVRSL